MKILLTGAFGNLGLMTLEELLRQGHQVRCFVSRRPVHRRTARRFAGSIELVQGDLRQPADLAQAVQDQDAIIHLAYLLPPQSEDQPDLARAINVDGTRNVLDAARSVPTPPIFFSLPVLMSSGAPRTNRPRAPCVTRSRPPITTPRINWPARRW